MHRKLLSLLALAPLSWLTSCTVDSPVDPASLFAPVNDAIENLQRTIDDAVSDPLESHPFPKLTGGDSERIFYATNLGDTRIRFPGPSSDVVLPGLLGPSNLYKHQDGERDLVRPLILAGALSALTTDGVSVAYVWYTSIDEAGVTQQVRHGGLSAVNDYTILETPTAEGEIVIDLRLVDGQLAMLLTSTRTNAGSRLVIQASPGNSATETAFAAPFILSFDLAGTRLAYAAEAETGDEVHFANTSTGEDRVIATTDQFVAEVFVTNNFVVWNERPWTGGPSRLMAYDIRTGTTQTWSDAVQGRLVGAHDEFFIVQRAVVSDNGSSRLVIERHEPGGQSKTLADFPDHGGAGQTHVLGDRVVFVNADGKIVVAPLNGEGRFNFAPY